MATETPVKDKPLWTERFTCADRPIPCDWCGYVPGRPAQYGTPGWVFPIEDVRSDEDGTLLARGIETRFTPPPGRTCPFGMTFEGARQARAQRVVRRVGRREITGQEAIDYLEALGIDVDMEVTEA